MTENEYDVVVVGGGPAGLSGALALSRARRRVLVVDAGSPRNAPAGQVHNYLGREGTPPAELLAIGRAEVERYGGEVVAGTVTAAKADGGGFRVELAGRTVSARRLLLATGLVDGLPELAGLAGRWGRTVLHCPYCHGWEVRDQAIGVLGTGERGVEQALQWRQWSPDVTLFLHSGPIPAAAEREQLEARGIAVVPGRVAGIEGGADVRLVDGTLVRRQALVVAPAFTPRSELLDQVGPDTPGVWAAGNLADPMAQVVSSAAAGLTAGADINRDLTAEDTRRAVFNRGRQSNTRADAAG